MSTPNAPAGSSRFPLPENSFRGMKRGGARGRPRGTRAGGGRNQNQEASAPAASSNASSSPASTTAPAQKPKQNSGPKRGPRTAPAVQVTISQADVPPANRPANKRRRSSAQATKTQQPIAATEEYRRRGPNNALETPPHLIVPSMRTDIDALVDHMRAAANRPNTPGDWARDDDDSLPDLGDWGLETSVPKTSNNKTNDKMSPLLVGALKALPEPSASIAKPVPEKTLERKPLVPRFSAASLVIPPFKKKVPAPAPPVKITAASLVIPPFNPNARRAPRSTVASVIAENVSSTAAVRVSPPKLAANAPIVQPEAKSEIKPVSIEANKSNEADKSIQVDKSNQVDTSKDDDKPADTTKEDHNSSKPGDNQAHKSNEDTPREGLSASIHAPDPLADSFSAPSGVSTFIPNFRRPQHGQTNNNRNNDLGRPQSFAQPRTAPSPGFPQHQLPRSAHQSMSQKEHSRTRSSPTHRSSRPTITGDAISRLARTITPLQIASKD